MDARTPATHRSVFTIDGTAYAWNDVVAYAEVGVFLRELERATRHGLACLRRLSASGEELGDEEMATTEAAFRYARNLVAAEDIHAWLDSWGLRTGEWRAYLRRSILRERWEDEVDAIATRFPPTDDEVDQAIWAEAVCSGFLEERASALAADLALALDAGESLTGGPDTVFPRVAAAAERARARVATDKAVEREVANHGLEWLRIEGTVLELPSEDLAREAALCVRDDGRTLRDVAADCGVEPRAVKVYVADVEPDLAAALVAAREGELVGPLPQRAAYALLDVEAKTPPGADDPEIRRKAGERLVAREVQRAIAANVKWHEPR